MPVSQATLAAVLLWGAAVLLPGSWTLVPALGLAALTGWAAHRRMWNPVLLGTVALVTMAGFAVPGLAALYPLNLLLGLGAALGVVRLAPGAGAEARAWWRFGHVGLPEVLMAVGFALTASIALVAWFHLAEPDLSDLLERMPAWSPALLVLLGLVFSTANAFAEEAAFRGIAQHAMERAWGVWPALAIQAALFGVLHIEGFPRGWIGVGLATVYGLMMGVLRVRSRGLAVPIVAHVLADATIFALLVTLA